MLYLNMAKVKLSGPDSRNPGPALLEQNWLIQILFLSLHGSFFPACCEACRGISTASAQVPHIENISLPEQRNGPLQMSSFSQT